MTMIHRRQELQINFHLMDEELDGEEIHDRETKDHAPKDRVGPDEGAVGESQHGYDEEEDQYAADVDLKSTSFVS